MSIVADSIARGVAELGQSLPIVALGRLEQLLTELGRWNRRVNLTAIRDPSDMVTGHVLDSLSVRPHLEGNRICDIGTGAGFPGLPLAIAEPSRQFVLLDSNGRKISFVRHMIRTLKLENATAVQARAEDYAPDQPFDTVIARALASLVRIAELSVHLTGQNGVLLAQKGRYPAAELEQMKQPPDNWEIRVTELHVPGLAPQSRHVVRLSQRRTS